MTINPIRNTLFVTFPRSGHTLLMDCLQEYFGEEMRYCENYHHCNTVPCLDPATNVQKTHDFDLGVKQEGQLIIVQTRAKPDALQSWFELRCKWDPDNVGDWMYPEFIREKGLFYDRWMMKWCTGGSFPVITYEWFMTHPEMAIAKAVILLTDDVKVDRSKISDIVEKMDIKPRRW